MNPINDLKIKLAKAIKAKFDQMNMSTTNAAAECGVMQSTLSSVLKLAEGQNHLAPKFTVEKLMLMAGSMDIKFTVSLHVEGPIRGFC